MSATKVQIRLEKMVGNWYSCLAFYNRCKWGNVHSVVCECRENFSIQHTSFSSSEYSLTLSTATILVSSSEVILTSQLRVWVTCKPSSREQCVSPLAWLCIIFTTRIITMPLLPSTSTLSVACVVRVWVTDIKGVGYRQANQATLQRVSGNDSKQSSEKNHQVSKELQTDGQPSADITNTHKYKVVIIDHHKENPIRKILWLNLMMICVCRRSWSSISDLLDTIHG